MKKLVYIEFELEAPIYNIALTDRDILCFAALLTPQEIKRIEQAEKEFYACQKLIKSFLK